VDPEVNRRVGPGTGRVAEVRRQVGGMDPFDVLFSLTVYRNGQVRVTTHNKRRDPALIIATLRDIALAMEVGAVPLSEYDDDPHL
jgi:ABC-type iron transport system FetAB ATPase subunit